MYLQYREVDIVISINEIQGLACVCFCLGFIDTDEPMLSGTGIVSKDCSELELASWSEVLHLNQWQNPQKRPKQLAALVKQSIPEALRGEVWQRLAGCENDNAMMDNYRLLITQVLYFWFNNEIRNVILPRDSPSQIKFF